MEFKVGDRVIYINKLRKGEIGTVTHVSSISDIDGKLKYVLVNYDNNDWGIAPTHPENLRKLTKLEKALA